MKISIDLKDNKYTITYGRFTATAQTVRDAVEAIVVEFRKTLEKFFIINKQ